MKQFTNTSFGFSPNCYLSFHHKKIDNMCKGTHFSDSKKKRLTTEQKLKWAGNTQEPSLFDWVAWSQEKQARTTNNQCSRHTVLPPHFLADSNSSFTIPFWNNNVYISCVKCAIFATINDSYNTYSEIMVITPIIEV